MLESIGESLSFSGRATRYEFFAFYAFCTAAGGAGRLLFQTPFSEPPSMPAIAWSILFLLALIPISVRRLHDQDRSAWWMAIWVTTLPLVLIAALLPQSSGGATLGFLAWRIQPAPGPEAALTFILLVVLIFAMLALNLLPGTRGHNRFGPDPRGRPAIT